MIFKKLISIKMSNQYNFKFKGNQSKKTIESDKKNNGLKSYVKDSLFDNVFQPVEKS